MVILFLSLCVSCPLARWFCTTWMTSCKGTIVERKFWQEKESTCIVWTLNLNKQFVQLKMYQKNKILLSIELKTRCHYNNLISTATNWRLNKASVLFSNTESQPVSFFIVRFSHFFYLQNRYFFPTSNSVFSLIYRTIVLYCCEYCRFVCLLFACMLAVLLRSYHY